MARSCGSRSVIALLLLGCLAGSAFAAHPRRQRHIDAELAADSGDSSSSGRLQCPDSPKTRGCAPRGCILAEARHAASIICDQCADDKAYVLQNAGTRKAVCGELCGCVVPGGKRWLGRTRHCL
jgi:hypothetical protein